MKKIIRYPSGLKLVVERLPAFSVSAGIWVNAGSRTENTQNNGISHFLEHMIFKGTDKLSAFDIANGFEGLGAAINAFTSKDCTCYFVKSVTDAAEQCFEKLSHIFLDSVFDKTEMDKEKNVVVEEIGMVEDSPEEVCYNIFAEMLFDGPLAQTILGPAENILRFTKTDIDLYMSQRYTPQNTVISFAGDIDLETADRLVKKYFLPKLKNMGDGEKNGIIQTKSLYAPRSTVKIDDFEQANLILGFESLPLNDKLIPTQALLSVILGGGMSSRLFQKVREQEGLAYSIYSNPTVHVGAGSFNICVNFTAANTGKVMDCIKSEVELLLQKGITKEEFARAKAQLKSSMVFAQENVQSQMLAFGKLLLLCDELYDMNKKLSEIENVTIDSLMIFAKDLFIRTPALAYLGRTPDAEPKW